jgi:hypothetical protein
MSIHDDVSIKDFYVVRISNKFFLVIELQMKFNHIKKEEVVFFQISSHEAENLKYMRV